MLAARASTWSGWSRQRLIAAGCCIALVSGVGVWWVNGFSQDTSAPVPPELPLSQLEPEVAAQLGALRDKLIENPRSGDAWARLGQAMLAYGVVREAAECFAQAEQLQPGEPRWPYLRGVCLHEHDPDAAVGHFRHALELRGRPGMRYLLADVLVSQGRLDEAQVEIEALMVADPANPRLRLLRGILASRRGQWRLCVNLLTPLSLIPETRRQSMRLLATAHRRLGDETQAAELARIAQSLPDDPPWADAESDACLTFARNLSVRFAEIQDLRKRHASEAEMRAIIQIINETKGKDDRAFALLATSLAHSGQVELSEKAAREALALNPDRRAGLVALASILLSRAEMSRETQGTYPPEALARLREVDRLAAHGLQQNANDAGLLYLRGRALCGLGQTERGLADLHAATLCRPDLIAAQYHLGVALLRAKRFGEARQVLTRAQSLAGPDDEPTKHALQQLAEAEKSK